MRTRKRIYKLHKGNRITLGYMLGYIYIYTYGGASLNPISFRLKLSDSTICGYARMDISVTSEILK